MWRHLSAPDSSGERRVYFEIEVGGWGAHPTADGASGFSAGFHNLANSPMEMCEALFPVMFTHYGLIPDSGGAGQRRGGLGLAREWRLESDWGVLAGSFDRFRYPPYGLNGGRTRRARPIPHVAGWRNDPTPLQNLRRPTKTRRPRPPRYSRRRRLGRPASADAKDLAA